jgi:hypothetical protein
MLDSTQLRQLIIQPALKDLQLYSPEAEELLVFTCANESNGGSYLAQIKGPALGIYQMEPATHNDIWVNYILNNNPLSLMLINNFGCIHRPDEYRLIYDLRYATAMARIHYRRVSEALPSSFDVNAIWDYYKKYYNTGDGAAQKDQAIHAYTTFTS